MQSDPTQALVHNEDGYFPADTSPLGWTFGSGPFLLVDTIDLICFRRLLSLADSQL